MVLILAAYALILFLSQKMERVSQASHLRLIEIVFQDFLEEIMIHAKGCI